MNAALKTVCIALLASGAFGCSGARSFVVAPTAEIPISMSSGMRGADGKLLAHEQKHVVGEFSMNYKAWGMWWKIISFTGDKDISSEINQQVKEARGDAVVNLDVRSGNCMWNAFTILGLLPGCSNVEIRGDIIKVSALAALTPKPSVVQPAPPIRVETPITPVTPVETPVIPVTPVEQPSTQSQQTPATP